MSDQYLVHLPDGTEYGPVDRPVLDAWRAEGRLPAETLVWPYGAPEWLTVEAALGPVAAAVATPAEPADVSRAAAAPVPATAKLAAVLPAKPVSADPTPHAPAPLPTPAKAAAAAPARSVAATASTRPAAGERARPALNVAQARPAHADSTAPGALAAGDSPLAALVASEPKGAVRRVTAAPAAARPGPVAKATAPAAAPLGTAAARPARPVAAQKAAPLTPAAAAGPAHGADAPDTKPRTPVPKFARDARARQGLDLRALRPLFLTALGLALVVAALVGLWAVLRPHIARRWAIASVNRQATADRRLEDRELGLVAELPTGWVALRPNNPFVPSPTARMRLAQPSIGAFASIEVAPRPRLMDALDARLDELLMERLPRQPSARQQGRADVQLGRGHGRLVRTTWQDGLTPMLGAMVVWADGYELFSLEAWAPAEAGAEFLAQIQSLCAGLRTTGLLESRVNDAVERLALDVPELRKDALRLLVAESMSRGQDLGGVPGEAVRTVSRGLDALAPGEAAEMRAIYQQIWEPVPEPERVHLASLMSTIKAGREVPGGDIQPLRDALKAGVLALPAEQQARLQELSGRAVRKSLASP